MVSASVQPAIQKATLEEYFEQEFHSKTKNEFINGQIVPMPYTSDNHGLIIANLIWHICNAVQGKNIRVYPSDRMVHSPFCNEVYYPDVVVVKDQPEFYQYKENMWATLNPSVLVKVLSGTTEEKDRNEKWPCYREIKSLQQFFLVSQNEPYVEYYTRLDDSSRWIYAYVNDLDATIPVLGYEIPLREIYALVEWEGKLVKS